MLKQNMKHSQLSTSLPGDAHDCALGRGVAPRLIVGGEDAHVAAADEVVVVEAEERVGGGEELGVEDHLDPVRPLVEELAPPDAGEHRVLLVVDHIVGGDGRGAGVLSRVYAPLQLGQVVPC